MDGTDQAVPALRLASPVGVLCFLILECKFMLSWAASGYPGVVPPPLERTVHA
jgi:hypothetical protein